MTLVCFGIVSICVGTDHSTQRNFLGGLQRHRDEIILLNSISECPKLSCVVVNQSVRGRGPSCTGNVCNLLSGDTPTEVWDFFPPATGTCVIKRPLVSFPVSARSHHPRS